jgi:hypothetical protein
MLGDHVIKTECGSRSPRSWGWRVRAIAMNKQRPSTTSRSPLRSSTSEPVEETLGAGQFGLVEETPALMNLAVNEGVKGDKGMGEALGEFLNEAHATHASLSLLARASQLGFPLTVHVAIGTDTLHQHPSFDGAATGAATHRDSHLRGGAPGARGGRGVQLPVGSDPARSS